MTKTTPPGLPRMTAAERAIWTNRNGDRRSIIDGVRYVLTLDSKTGATVLSPLSAVAKEEAEAKRQAAAVLSADLAEARARMEGKERPAEALTPPWGLRDAAPSMALAVWGARAIAKRICSTTGGYCTGYGRRPAARKPEPPRGSIDLLWDRQGIAARNDVARDRLSSWLNGGAMEAALSRGEALIAKGEIRSDEAGPHVLHEDALGVVVADTRASYGYLYMAAWLKGA